MCSIYGHVRKFRPYVLKFMHQNNIFSGKTALFHAINTHNVSAVMLLIKQSCDVNKTSYVAYHRDNQLLSCVEPPLITAVRVGCHEVIQLLLAFGAKVRHRMGIYIHEQECIPVGCVPSAAVSVCLSACWNTSPWAWTPPDLGLETLTPPPSLDLGPPHLPPGYGPGDPPPVNRMTDTCKNITLANFVCGR